MPQLQAGEVYLTTLQGRVLLCFYSENLRVGPAEEESGRQPESSLGIQKLSRLSYCFTGRGFFKVVIDFQGIAVVI